MENYDCDEELGGVVISARKVNSNSYLHIQTNDLTCGDLTVWQVNGHTVTELSNYLIMGFRGVSLVDNFAHCFCHARVHMRAFNYLRIG